MATSIPREACFDVPAWHRTLFAEHAARTPEVARVAAVGDAKATGFGDGYMPELYHRLYAQFPSEVTADKRGPAAAVRASLHKLAGELPEFETLRKQTVSDATWAGMASTVLGESVASALPKRDPNAPPNDAERADRILDGLRDLLADGAATESDVARAAGESFRAAEATEDAAATIDESAVRQALRRGVEAAHDVIDAAKSAASALGYGPGTLSGSGVTPAVAIDLARKVASSEKLRRIIAMAGRLQATARAKRATRSDYARSELVGVEPTGDIARLLPSELGAFGHATRTVDLLRRVSERTALGYKVRGKDKSRKGPIVVGIDISSSMDGEPDIWAKAIALAILDTARRDNRAFGVILYNGAVVDELYVEKPQDADPARVLKLLLKSPVGGCNFDVPVAPALDAIERARGGGAFGKADVILITDAIARADRDGYKERADKLGTTIYGILIGRSGEAVLKSYSHEVARIDDVSRDSAAVDLVFDKV